VVAPNAPPTPKKKKKKKLGQAHVLFLSHVI